MQELGVMVLQHEGVELVGAVGVPKSPGPHPAVMVMHTALGLSPMMRERVDRLVGLGYVGVATDMYGGGQYHADPAGAGAPMTALLNAPQRLRARAVAWYEQIKARPDVDPRRVAAIGFCFGGLCVLELARSGADVRAVVSYHGLLKALMPADAGAFRGQIAIYSGAKDPYAPAEDVETLRREMTGAGAQFRITVFNEACHAFTDPHAAEIGRAGIAYDAIADRVSWAGTVALLEATLA
jgi:dienelactone hydrolase